MKVLLINSNRERAPQPAIPLGVCLVASSLAASHPQATLAFETRVLDLCFAREVNREIARAAEEFRPEAIGLSVRNLDNGDFLRPRSYLQEAQTLLAVVRSITRAPLIIGGPAVNVAPRELLRALGADYAIAGDGEQALPGLLQVLQAGADPSNLPGVYAARRASPASGSAPPAAMARVADIETLPFAQVARWVDLRGYLRYGCPMPVQTKRGCQFECTYCTYYRIEGSHYRLRSPQTIAQEMWETKSKWKVNHFEFVDSTFNHPLEHAIALCEAVIRSGLGASLQTAGLHPGSTSRELLQLMKRAGFEAVVCTPDSGSERVLERLKKGFALDDIARTACWAREADLPMLWSFIFGAPGEREETVRATLRFVEALLGPRDRLLCTLGLRVYPGTELARVAVQEGVLASGADLVSPTFYFSPEITPARVLALLDASKFRRQMIFLTSLQSKLVPLGMRLRHALRLPGPPWVHVPLYNAIMRMARRAPRTGH